EASATQAQPPVGPDSWFVVRYANFYQRRSSQSTPAAPARLRRTTKDSRANRTCQTASSARYAPARPAASRRRRSCRQTGEQTLRPVRLEKRRLFFPPHRQQEPPPGVLVWQRRGNRALLPKPSR